MKEIVNKIQGGYHADVCFINEIISRSFKADEGPGKTGPKLARSGKEKMS